jgi:hypothetical protein
MYLLFSQTFKFKSMIKRGVMPAVDNINFDFPKNLLEFFLDNTSLNISPDQLPQDLGEEHFQTSLVRGVVLGTGRDAIIREKLKTVEIDVKKEGMIKR